MTAWLGLCLLGGVAPFHASGRLSTTPIWTFEGEPYAPVIGLLGLAVGSAGDVDGDGFDDLIVGAPGSGTGCCQPGAVFVFRGSVAGPGVEPDAHVVPGLGAGYGAGVASAGDVNGDGRDDVLFSGSYDGTPILAVVHHGTTGGSGIAYAPAWTFNTASSGTFWPSAVSGAGDVNGDGYDDVIVGNRGYTQSVTRQGRALVFLGSASGLSTTAAWTVIGVTAQENLGFTVAAAGDVNADGFGDVLLGTKNQARLYLGSAGGLGLTPSWTAPMQPVLGDYHSYGEVASAGDVDADGYDDVIVGSPAFTSGETQEGAARLYRGSGSGLSVLPISVLQSNRAGALFGCSVDGAGDVDADGHADLIIGDCGLGGRASLFLGSPSGPAQDPAWFIDAPSAWSQFGRSVRGAGDVNADGRDDVIVGAPYGGEGFDGQAFLYLGVPSETTGPAPGAPDGSGAEPPLLIARDADDALTLSWGVSCLASEMDWEVYEGSLGDFTSHTPALCSTGGQRGARWVPAGGDRYVLVVPRTLDFEGSYGSATGGLTREPGASACLPQGVAACP